jgi:uncharacterized protein YueI
MNNEEEKVKKEKNRTLYLRGNLNFSFDFSNLKITLKTKY